MQATIEAENNKKALAYTTVIVATLLLLALFITWPVLQPPAPLVEDLIEINLGNNEEGMGDVQPLIKGEMAPSQQPAAQQQVQPPSNEATAAAIEPDDKADEDAAPIAKPEKVTPKAKVVTTTPVTKPVKTATPAPVVMPTPKPQQPKATYNGGGASKGNGATEDNGYTYQGKKPGGKGDVGDPSGKPDSYGNSPGGKSGARVTFGKAPLNLGTLRFEEEFNQNAKVSVEVHYNAAGAFISSSIVKPTTTTDATITGIAKRKAAELKFPPNDDGGISTILFNFRVN